MRDEEVISIQYSVLLPQSPQFPNSPIPHLLLATSTIALIPFNNKSLDRENLSP